MKVVIIGGGAVGSSTAYHLARDPAFKGSITVVERDPTYRIASSSLSASSIRQQFSTPVCIRMSQYGRAFLGDGAALLEVDGDRPALGYRERGYLFLASAAGAPVLRENHAVQTAEGADISLLTPAEIASRWPWMSTDGVALGAWGNSGEGWFDGPALLAALRRKARALGVTYLAQDAAGLVLREGRVAAVRLGDGSEVPCDMAVNAAGAWSARVAGFAGIDLPIRARKRMIYVFRCAQPIEGSGLVIDPEGIFFRPEGAGFICGRSPGEGEPDPDEPPLAVEEEMFLERVWPVLAHRVPAFAELRRTGEWAGYYEYNTFDQNGVIGAHPACPNLIHAAGFSGHGIQHSPATGRGVAELVAHGGFTTLDLSPLGFGRIIRGEPLVEKNIV
ncbi:MAG: FAD-binding oxidoreductase [Alphaproteobacteria bacterium]|nr:FAD-binding oxidoreductase [Alphaproteobacteria bacterium]